MPSYSPSTIARIGDIKNGLLVETTDMSYTLWGTAQAELFTVYNRIVLHAMWIEVTATSLVGAGTLLNYTWTNTVPVVALQNISAASADIDSMDRGERIVWQGTTLATAAVLSTEGVSLHPSATGIPFIVGIAPSTTLTSYGTIGCLPTIAVLTAGTGKAGLLYTPIDPGAYVEALL